MEYKPYVTIKEAAKLTGVSEFFIRQNLKEKRLPVIMSGSKYLLSTSGLFKYLDELAAQNCRG